MYEYISLLSSFRPQWEVEGALDVKRRKEKAVTSSNEKLVWNLKIEADEPNYDEDYNDEGPRE